MLKEFIQKIVKGTFKPTLTPSGEFLLKKTDFGLVKSNFVVVQKIAERALRSVKGIGEAEVVIKKFSSASPLKILLTLTLSEKYSAPKVSEAADKAINEDFKKFLGLEFYVPVEVKIKQITQTQPQRRRVR